MPEKPENGIAVNIRGGTYDIKNPIVFGANHSGTADCPVVYRAYNDETVTFKASQSLDATKIVKVEDEAVLDRLIEPAAKNNIYMIDLVQQGVEIPAVNIYSTVPDSEHTPVARFFLNGKALHEARWPNDSDIASECFTSAELYSSTGYNTAGKPAALKFADSENRSSDWNIKSGESSIIGAVGFLWRQECLKIGSVDSANKIVYTSEEAFDSGAGDEDRYIYFSNIFEELDAPGESYIDRENGILYFYHEGDLPENSTLEFANNWSSTSNAEPYNMRNILIFDGASNITFSGIDFKFSSDSMIRIARSESITIENAVISGGGRKTVMKIDGSGHKIRNCVFEDYVGTAISLSGGDRASLSSSGTVISNNIFCKNLLCLNAVEVAGVGHILSNNEFYDIGKAAVRFTNTNNCVFEYNKVKNAQRIGDDGGALYWGRNISELGNIVRYNCFEDIDSGLGANPTNAIFIDDGGAGPEIYGNIFNNAGRSASGPIRTNGGNNIYVHDNIIMNSKSAGCMKGWANSLIGLSVPIQPAHTWLSHNAFLDGLGDSYENNPDFSFAEEYAVNNPKELMFSEVWIDYYTNVEPTGNWADLFTYYTKENYNACKELYDKAIELSKSNSGVDKYWNYPRAVDALKAWVEDNLPQIITNRWKNNVYINVEELYPVNRTDVENDPSPNGAIVENNLNLGTDTSVFSDYILTDDALATIRESIPAFENPDYSMMGVQK